MIRISGHTEISGELCHNDSGFTQRAIALFGQYFASSKVIGYLFYNQGYHSLFSVN